MFLIFLVTIKCNNFFSCRFILQINSIISGEKTLTLEGIMIRPKPVSTCQQLTSFVCTPFVAAGKALSNVAASVRSAVSGIFSCISNLFSNREAHDLQEENNSLKRQLKELNTRINRAQSNLENSEEIIAKKEEIIEVLTSQNANLQATRSQAENKVQNAETALQRAMEELTATQKKNVALSDEIATAKANVTEAEKKLLAARESLTKADKSVAESNKKLKELREEKTHFENLVKEQKVEIEKLTGLLMTSKEENEKLKELSGDKEGTMAKVIELGKQINELNQQLSAVQSENTTIKTQLADTKNSVTNLQTALTTARKKIEEHQKELEKSHKEVISLKAEIEGKKVEILQAKNKSSQSAEETKKLLQELSNLESRSREKESEKVLLSGRLEQLNQTVKIREEVLKQEQEKVSRLEKELNIEKTRSNSTNETLAKKELELAESKRSLTEKESKLSQQQSENKQVEQLLKKVRNEVESLKSQIEAKNTNLVGAEQKSSESANKLEQLKADLEELKSQFNLEHEELEKTKKELELAQKNASINSEALAISQKELETLQAKLALLNTVASPFSKIASQSLLAITYEDPTTSPLPVPSSPAAVSPVVVSPSQMNPKAEPFTPPGVIEQKSPKEVQKEPGKVDKPAFVLPAPAISLRDITPVKNAKGVKANLLVWKKELLGLFDDQANLCCNLLALQKLQALNKQINQVDLLLKKMEKYVNENPKTKQVSNEMKLELDALTQNAKILNGKRVKDLEAIQEEMIQLHLPMMIYNLSQLFDFNQEALERNSEAKRHLEELRDLETSFNLLKEYFEKESTADVLPSRILDRIALLKIELKNLKEKHGQVLGQIAGPSAPSIESNVADPSNSSTNPEQVLNNLRTLYHSQKALLKGQLEEVQGLIEEMPSLEDAVEKSWQATGRLQSGRNVLGKIRAHEAKLSRMEEHLTIQIDFKVNASNLEELEKFTSKQTILTKELKDLKKNQENWRNISEVSQELFNDGAKARGIYLFSRNKKIETLEKEYAQLVNEASTETSTPTKQIEYRNVLSAQREFLEFKEKLETFALDPKYAEVEFKKIDEKLTDLKAKKVPEEKNGSKTLLGSLGSLFFFGAR
jgi:DNA repair exonuclease SbcCD ATPase subunit